MERIRRKFRQIFGKTVLREKYRNGFKKKESVEKDEKI